MLRLLGILALGNMICGRRRNGGFPGGLLLLPALMFGGWMALAIAGSVLSLIGAVIGGIFSGLASLAFGVFSEGGLLIGVVIGLVLYYAVRRQKNEAREEE